MPEIVPTPGRIVWYQPGSYDSVLWNAQSSHGTPRLAAIVAHVWNDRMVNLAVFDPAGVSHSRTSVPLLQSEDKAPAIGSVAFCEWMPYQRGQAAKAETLEAKLAEKGDPTAFDLGAKARAAGPTSY